MLKELTLILYNLFQEPDNTFQFNFWSSNYQYPNQEWYKTQNYRSTALINIDAKLLTKYHQTEISTIKKIYYTLCPVGLVLGLKGNFNIPDWSMWLPFIHHLKKKIIFISIYVEKMWTKFNITSCQKSLRIGIEGKFLHLIKNNNKQKTTANIIPIGQILNVLPLRLKTRHRCLLLKHIHEC